MIYIGDLIDELDQSYKLEEIYVPCVQFMLDCLDAVRSKLPKEAEAGLGVAEKYWRDGDKTVSLEKARVELWQSIDARRRDVHTTDPWENGMRAVLFVLHEKPDASDDVDDVLGWFTHFMDAVDPKLDTRPLLVSRLRTLSSED